MKFTLILLSLILYSLSSFAESFSQMPLPYDTIVADTSALTQISSHPKMFLSPMDEDVDENSGIILYHGKIWTHNDSGGEPELYAIDTVSGAILQTLFLKDGENVDWEDIAQDADFIYVADVGNNRGNRKDLKIYKFSKALIPAEGDAQIEDIEVISFTYADQESYEKAMNRNDFDCESLTSFGDSLYIFTKNWDNQKTRVYALPKLEGNFVIKPKSEFEADGLLTAADVSPDGTQLALLGYIDFESFMWLFWDFEGDDFFSGQKLRINFPDMVFVQTEGICYISDERVLISCEESSEFPSLFLVNTSELIMTSESKLGNYFSDDIILSGMPPEVSKKLKVDILKLPEPGFSFELHNNRWDVVSKGEGVIKDSAGKMRISIKTKDLKNGLYFLKISSGDFSLIRKVRVKN